jgi:hypothetical protein
MTFDDAIQVLQAAKVGKSIQRRVLNSDNPWRNILPEAVPSLDFSCYEYRVKPEPRCFVVYLMEDKNGALFTSSIKALENSVCVGSAKLVEGVFQE